MPQLARDPRAIALLLAASLTVMANATISPALPKLTELFRNEPHAAELSRLLVSAPSLAVALLAPCAGFITDRIGRRTLLLTGMVLFVTAGCAGLFLPSLTSILFSRILLGVAVALIVTAQTALVGDYFTEPDRTTLIGWQISARNLGGLIFIPLAGVIALMSARAPFAIYALPLVFLPLMWKAIIEPVHQSPSQQKSGNKPQSRWVLSFSGILVLQMLSSGLFFLLPTQLPFYLTHSVLTGVALGVLCLTGGLAALCYRHIAQQYGLYRALALGYVSMAIGFTSLALANTAIVALIGSVCVGAGYALVSPPYIALALRLAPAYRRGLASGFLSSSIFAGQFISPIVSTSWILNHGHQPVFATAAAILLLLGIIGLTQSLAS